MKSNTPLKSIRLKCLDCSSTSSKVQQCQNSDCPLYPLRLGKNVPRGTSRVKAIRQYCVSSCMNEQPTEVRQCPTEDCPLFPFRFGTNPNRRKSQDEAAAEKSILGQKVGVERGVF